MWWIIALTLFALANAEPCVCECKCDEVRRHLESVHDLHQKIDRLHRTLQSFPDPTEILNDISNATAYITNGLEDVKDYLLDVRDDVYNSAVNVTNSVTDRVTEFKQDVVDEVDVVKENVASAANTALNTIIYAVVGVIGGMILLGILRCYCARRGCFRKKDTFKKNG